MVLPEANAGGVNFPTASQLSARLVKASSEAPQIGQSQAHRRIRTSDTEVAPRNRVSIPWRCGVSPRHYGGAGSSTSSYLGEIASSCRMRTVDEPTSWLWLDS